MKVITLDDPRIYLVPRVYPDLTDTLKITVVNEETGEAFEEEPIWTIEKNLIKIAVLETNLLSPLANYEFSITNVTVNNSLIYKGKFVLLENGTDIQNFEPQTQDTARWQE